MAERLATEAHDEAHARMAERLRELLPEQRKGES